MPPTPKLRQNKDSCRILSCLFTRGEILFGAAFEISVVIVINLCVLAVYDEMKSDEVFCFVSIFVFTHRNIHYAELLP